jgi:hypothetical protein
MASKRRARLEQMARHEWSRPDVFYSFSRVAVKDSLEGPVLERFSFFRGSLGFGASTAIGAGFYGYR